MVDRTYDYLKRRNENPSKLLVILLLPVIIPHELIHYFTGKLLGLEVHLHLRSVSCKYDHWWQDMIVGLAPTLISVILVMYSLTLERETLSTLLVTAFAFLSLGLCILDLLSVLKKIADLFRPAK